MGVVYCQIVKVFEVVCDCVVGYCCVYCVIGFYGFEVFQYFYKLKELYCNDFIVKEIDKKYLVQCMVCKFFILVYLVWIGYGKLNVDVCIFGNSVGLVYQELSYGGGCQIVIDGKQGGEYIVCLQI